MTLKLKVKVKSKAVKWDPALKTIPLIPPDQNHFDFEMTLKMVRLLGAKIKIWDTLYVSEIR